jgi:hypothetical protein
LQGFVFRSSGFLGGALTSLIKGRSRSRGRRSRVGGRGRIESVDRRRLRSTTNFIRRYRSKGVKALKPNLFLATSVVGAATGIGVGTGSELFTLGGVLKSHLKLQ